MSSHPTHRPSDRARPSRGTAAALAIAGLSLFVALDGSAVAAQSMVTARHIATGAVTSAKVKKGAITMKHMSPAARKALRGARGAAGANGAGGANGLSGTNGANGLTGATGSAGATGGTGGAGATGGQGPKGDTGDPGDPGADGVVTPLSVTAGQVLLLTATPPTTVVERSVPAGKYIVLGKTQITHSGAGDSVHCELKTGAQVIDQVD
ncbi:MAG TPA: hypothetical protein VFY44_09875, partial [Thermoleophilaceae bacterium]|nr:hypothetical protein [Thermoleophilaceae bacterium]